MPYTYSSRNAFGILTSDGSRIPYDETNGDYQEYLAWIAAGNTAPPYITPSSSIGDDKRFFDNIAVGGSEVHFGTDGYVLINNAGVIGEIPITTIAVTPHVIDGRLTLSSNTPVVQPNASSATTLYYTPYLGNRVSLYNGSAWVVYAFSQLSIAVPSTSNTNYDVYLYDNSGTLTLDLTAWTNDTTRATALTRQDGVLVKTGATSRRYIGTVRTSPTTGYMDDTPGSRHVWNMYNRVSSHLYAGTTGSYNYTTGTWRAAGNDTGLGSGRVQWVCGQNTHIQLTNYQLIYNASVNLYAAAGIAIDRTDGNDAQILGTGITANDSPGPCTAFYDGVVTPGCHYGQRVEISGNTSGTTTWYNSVSTIVAIVASGLRGSIFC